MRPAPCGGDARCRLSASAVPAASSASVEQVGDVGHVLDQLTSVPGAAIEVIRPLADAGDDIAGMWLARWLADAGHLDELRERAASESYHAVNELAEWLALHKDWAELRELMGDHWELLAGWQARQHDENVWRLAAELGDDDARLRLDRWLSRQRERAAESESRRAYLAELEEDPDWAPFLPLRPD